MILYAVQRPRFEDEGDGEDTRQWFSSLEKARRRFRELVTEGQRHRTAYEKANRIKNLDKRSEALWAYTRITLDKYDIPMTRTGLIDALNRQLYPCSKTLEVAAWF